MSSKKNGRWRWVWALILLISLCVLGGGYWLYYQSIEQAVYATTFSFMEQIADHDHFNIVNQMDSKTEYLQVILGRISASRDSRFEDVLYELGVEAKTTSFDTLYLITTDDEVYSSSYLEAPLQDMPWAEEFQSADGHFVIRYDEVSREKWGEFLVYGVRRAAPVSCGGKEISGAVGLIPISEIADQMRLESFDGQGIAVVMQKSGDIITASQQYSTPDNNFLTPLEAAQFKNEGSLEACAQAIERGESLFVEYSLDDGSYYTLFQPLDHHAGSEWYLVVRVSTQVTADQVKTLIFRSIPFFFVLGILILGIAYLFYHNMNEAKIARASEQAKSTFLANMSHEIRTPLNGIVGLLYLMNQNLGEKEKLREYLKKAEVSAAFLQSVITDVLDMSKIESGQLEIYQKELDLNALIEEVHILLENQAARNGLRFCIDCQELKEPFVQGDALRIKQILTNLLGNAVKFTPEGGEVSLSIKQEVSDMVVNTVFRVADTGCGMSPEFLERIWLPFEQERRAASQNGTGLGTTLSKTLTEKMGGTISVESQLGKGTVFTVSIPFQVAKFAGATSGDSSEAPQTLSGKRILVVEDNEINRMIVVSILEGQGCILTEARDGQEALSTFEESPLYGFDLILMDVQMPVMDGYEATRRIRSLSRPDALTVPIIAMTANAFSEDIDEALAAGMDEVAIKPLDIKLLFKKMEIIRDGGGTVMRKNRMLSALLAGCLCLFLAGCQIQKAAVQEKITLIVKTPPIGLGNIPGKGEMEVYDMLTRAAERFQAQYDRCDVEFSISRYDYLDEQAQLVDKYGTPESADIFFSGSWNVPLYAKRGWLVPLDDMVDEELRADIDEAVWAQNSIGGQIYTMPYHQLQNTLMVNRAMMQEAGLTEYIPANGAVAHWSTEEFNLICQRLSENLADENTFAFMMYAANNQGDNHIMTLFRAYGCTLYDQNGNFAVNTPEGIQALAWIKEMDEQGITPKGAENLEFLDCINLFYNKQLAICVGNLTNLWDAKNKGVDVFTANFPDLTGAGYCTASSNGFCVFDNGDETRIQVAKDFIRFLYTDEEAMEFTLGTLPVQKSIIEQYQDEIWMLKAYGENTQNAVDNIHGSLNWQGVRDVFYLNIRELLMKKKSPEEVAAAIDESCNAALEKGRSGSTN